MFVINIILVVDEFIVFFLFDFFGKMLVLVISKLKILDGKRFVV